MKSLPVVKLFVQPSGTVQSGSSGLKALPSQARSSKAHTPPSSSIFSDISSSSPSPTPPRRTLTSTSSGTEKSSKERRGSMGIPIASRPKPVVVDVINIKL